MKQNGMPEGVRSVIFWTIGLGVLAFLLFVFVIIFGNLQGNSGFGQNSSAIINETLTLTDAGVQPTEAGGLVNGNLTNIIITNSTAGQVIVVANYTASGTTITATASSEYNNTAVNVSATISGDSNGLIASDNVVLNFTQAATNTSTQFPTVGTILGIGILIVIMIGLLVFAVRRMMGAANAVGGSSGSGSSKFTGSSREFG